MIGIIYFFVIIFANSLGAVSGMGGGVIIKPVLDFIGAHSVASVSFYSAVAVFTMSIVSTIKQVKNGVKIHFATALYISLGALLGGYLGNGVFDYILNLYSDDKVISLIQIGLTILTLLFAYMYSVYDKPKFKFNNLPAYIFCGLILGFLASLLGIGGGPINVSLLMLMFSIPIKDATVYSIVIIFFSQLSKIITIGLTAGFSQFDMSILYFVVPAAIIGGFLGAKLSRILSSEKVVVVFRAIIILVIGINLYNGIALIV